MDAPLPLSKKVKECQLLRTDCENQLNIEGGLWIGPHSQRSLRLNVVHLFASFLSPG